MASVTAYQAEVGSPGLVGVPGHVAYPGLAGALVDQHNGAR
jgi:hypothetical protein